MMASVADITVHVCRPHDAAAAQQLGRPLQQRSVHSQEGATWMFGGLRHAQPAGAQESHTDQQAPQPQQDVTGWGLQRMLAGQPLLAAQDKQPRGSPTLHSRTQQPPALETQQSLQLAQQVPSSQRAPSISEQHVPTSSAMRRYGRLHSPAACLHFNASQPCAMPGSTSQQVGVQHQHNHHTNVPQSNVQQEAQHVATAQQPPSQRAYSAAAQTVSAMHPNQQPLQQPPFCSGVFEDDDEEVLPELLLSEQLDGPLQQRPPAQQAAASPQKASLPTNSSLIQHSTAALRSTAAQQHAGQPHAMQAYHEQHTPQPCGSASTNANTPFMLPFPSR